MALHFGVRLTCQGHTPRIMALTKSGNYVHLGCWSTSSIFHKSVSKHPHCRIQKWMNLGYSTSPLGPQLTRPTLGIGRSESKNPAMPLLGFEPRSPSS
jgi:hypothetical protein